MRSKLLAIFMFVACGIAVSGAQAITVTTGGGGCDNPANKCYCAFAKEQKAGLMKKEWVSECFDSSKKKQAAAGKDASRANIAEVMCLRNCLKIDGDKIDKDTARKDFTTQLHD